MASNAAKIREWSSRLERFRRSAKTVTRFCSDEQVSIQAFYYWRDRVQANLRGELQANWGNNQSLPTGNAMATGKAFATGKALATGNASAIGKAPAIGQQVSDSDSDRVRLVIRIGAISIECHAEPSSAIDAVLSWASRNQDGSFKQLIAR